MSGTKKKYSGKKKVEWALSESLNAYWLVATHSKLTLPKFKKNTYSDVELNF